MGSLTVACLVFIMATISTETSGSGALSVTVSPGREFNFDDIRLHLNTECSASEVFTITLDSEYGPAHDQLLFSKNMNGVKDLQAIDTGETRFLPADRWLIEWPNSQSILWGVEVRYLA